MNAEYCLDANAFITPWVENYRKNVFPSLWKRLSDKKEEIAIIKPVFEEIEPWVGQDKTKLSSQEKKRKYPLRMWLIEQGFQAVELDGATSDLAIELQQKYEIRKRSKGASENDIYLIAYTKQHQKTVVTFEARQLDPPAEKHNYKIPLICKLEEVQCITFIEFLQDLEIEI